MKDALIFATGVRWQSWSCLRGAIDRIDCPSCWCHYLMVVGSDAHQFSFEKHVELKQLGVVQLLTT